MKPGSRGPIKIPRYYNILRIPPLDRDVTSALTDIMRFDRFVLRTPEGGSANISEDCYEYIDIAGRQCIIVGAGLTEEIDALLTKMGFEPYFPNIAAPSEKRLEASKIDWGRVEKALSILGKQDMRDWQRDLIRVMEEHRCGQIITSTGSGKTTALAVLCYAMPKARIMYCVQQKQALADFYSRCRELGMDAKLTNSRATDNRIICCTAYKAHYFSDRKHTFDYMFVDEHHMTCTQRLMRSVLGVRCHKIFAFSANVNQRIDKGDRLSDIAYGPVRLKLTYAENVKANNIVPIRVVWRSRPEAHQAQKDYGSAYARKTYGLYLNDVRNQLIAEDALRHPNEQVLILVNFVVHALALRKLLNCPVVHSKVSSARWAELYSLGLVKRGEEPIDKDEVTRLRHQFTAGDLNLVIATGVWGQAVDFPKLSVLIRGDAMQSEIKTTQYCGRPSRVYPGKKEAIIYDYKDEHDSTLYNGHFARKSAYRKMGWEQSDYEG